MSGPDVGQAEPIGARGARRVPAILRVLALAFALRAGLMMAAALTTSGPMVHRSPDSRTYLLLAHELAETGRFTRGGEPELIRTPGYPLLLAPGVKAGQVEAVTITAQILLSCATVYVVYRIARLLFERESVALFCALLYAVEPLSVVYANKLLSETLFALVLALGLWGLAAYLRVGGRWALAGAAVALAASAYVRPVSYLLPALVALALVVRALARWAGPRRLVDAALFLVISMGLLGAWQVRNMVQGGYGGFAAIVDETVYFYQGASVLAAEQGKPYYRVQKQMGYQDPVFFQLMHLEQANWSRAEKFRYLRREGMKIVLKHPMTYVRIHLKGMARLMLDPGGLEYLRLFEAYPESGGLLGEVVDKGLWGAVAKLWRERPGAFLLNVALGAVLLGYLGLAVVGALRRGFWANGGLVALLLTAAYLVVMSGGPQAEGRFRHPVMVIVCVMAGAGWMMLRRKRTQAGTETAS